MTIDEQEEMKTLKRALIEIKHVHATSSGAGRIFHDIYDVLYPLIKAGFLDEENDD